MAREKKPYRLIRGKHRMPNPNFQPGVDDDETMSHVVAQEGDICHLTDDQFKSFHDKFRPVASDSTDVKDADEQRFQDAKDLAAVSGQNIDPNKPLEPQVHTGNMPQPKDPFASVRP